jgi:hypothetical protein
MDVRWVVTGSIQPRYVGVGLPCISNSNQERVDEYMKGPSLLITLFNVLSLITCTAQTNTTPNSFDPYVGIYKADSNDVVSIAKFDLGDGQNRLLFTDFESGLIRILSPTSGNSFSAGTGLLMNPPVEMQVSFARKGRKEAMNFVWQQNGLARRVANKVSVRREEVSFRNGEVTLSGTLITPSTRGLHPAVVFLHGSGALNRYSFGPFPDFFLSRGFAVSRLR